MRVLCFFIFGIWTISACAPNSSSNEEKSTDSDTCTDDSGDIDASTVSDWTDEERLYLTGRGPDDAVEWDFQAPDASSSSIAVPSNWELEGFGTYNHFEESETVRREIGVYERAFDVPEAWRNLRVFIVFEGVLTDTDVKVNGYAAGPTHQGGFTRFQYEITDHIRWNENNTLSVTVQKRSSDRSVNSAERKADYWLLGGIYRPVYLKATPKRFVERIVIDAEADGAFRADVFLDGPSSPNETISVTVTDESGAQAGAEIIDNVPVDATQVSVSGAFDNIKTWTAETPNLYTAEVSLLSDETVLHRVSSTFGFRTVEVVPKDGIYINGVKVRFKGCNRQAFRPESGWALDPADSLEDVRLIKQMNMNAVRAGYTPPDDHFLDYCDSHGLYVIEGLPGWQEAYDTEIGLEIQKEMVTRDVNHPSIIFWANGHEGGWNTQLDDHFSDWDPSERPVLHPWETFNDVNTDHYESYDSTAAILEGEDIFMPTEFLHALYDGGAGAGLADYWSLMESSPLSAGGFLFELCDEGIVRSDMDNKLDMQGNEASDGILGPYREKEGSFDAIQKIWSPVVIPMTDLPEDFNGTVEVENHYHFTNLSQVSFSCQFLQFDFSNGEMTSRVVAEQEIKSPSIAPGESGFLYIRLPAMWRDTDALLIIADNPDGSRISQWSYMLFDASAAESFFDRREDMTDRTATWAQVDDEIVVTAGDMTYSFSTSTGRLTEVLLGSSTVPFANGPRPTWDDTDTPMYVTVHEDGNDIAVDAACCGDQSCFTWVVKSDGRLRLSYRYLLEGDFDYFGVSFDFPESEMLGAERLGIGPSRVWKNRMEGGTFDVWRRDYNDTVTGLSWTYPEFKGYFADVYWARLITDWGDIQFQINTDNIYLRLFTPDAGETPMNAQADFPSGDISFLHAIPPIGTKFLAPENLGPEGSPNHAENLYEGQIEMVFNEAAGEENISD